MRSSNLNSLTFGILLGMSVRWGITHYNSANYILKRRRSAAAGCLSAYRPCNSPAGGVRATAISSWNTTNQIGEAPRPLCMKDLTAQYLKLEPPMNSRMREVGGMCLRSEGVSATIS